MRISKIVNCCICLAIVSNGFSAGIKLSYESIWPGFANSKGYTPLRVEIKNTGPNAIGLLKIITTRGQIAYPIDVPTNGDKVLTTYMPEFDSYSTPQLIFESNVGKFTENIELKNEASESRAVIGVISSESGLLSSFKPKIKNKQVGMATEIKPEMAPDRSIGYNGLDLVVLSQGSERLGEGAIYAIQRYVLSGGKLLVVGGASSPWLSDNRWDSVMPIRPLGVANVVFPSKIAEVALDVAGKPVTITDSVIANGGMLLSQSGNKPIIAKKSVGLGEVIFVAFDIFSGDIQKSKYRNELILSLCSVDNQNIDDNMNPYWDREPVGNNSASPFQFQIPPTWKIVAILAGFFVVVIPINFLVLQKLNRRELAWVSIPITSVLFSFLIFLTASSLYQAKKSRHTTGLVLCTEGSGQALFDGAQQVFLPMSGTYDLGFQNVEGATDAKAMRGWTMGGSLLEGNPEMFDFGQVVVPRLEATSLTFKDYDLKQAVTFQGRISVNYSAKKVGDNWELSGTISNNTPLHIRSPRLRFSGQNIDVPEIRPESRVLFKGVSKSDNLSKGSKYEGENLALVGVVEGLPLGSSIGAEVDDKEGPVLVYTFSAVGPR